MHSPSTRASARVRPARSRRRARWSRCLRMGDRLRILGARGGAPRSRRAQVPARAPRPNSAGSVRALLSPFPSVPRVSSSQPLSPFRMFIFVRSPAARNLRALGRRHEVHARDRAVWDDARCTPGLRAPRDLNALFPIAEPVPHSEGAKMHPSSIEFTEGEECETTRRRSHLAMGRLRSVP